VSYVATVNVQLNDEAAPTERERMLREVLLPRAKAGLDAMITDRPAAVPPILAAAIHELILES
jgi:hypothetical protein